MTDDEIKKVIEETITKTKVRTAINWPNFVGQVTLFLGVATVALQANCMHKETNTAITNAQDSASKKAIEVKESLDQKEDITYKQLKNLQKGQETIVDTLGPQLYSTWKYLEQVSLDTQNAVDKQKAEDAKKAYIDFINKKSKGP